MVPVCWAVKPPEIDELNSRPLPAQVERRSHPNWVHDTPRTFSKALETWLSSSKPLKPPAPFSSASALFAAIAFRSAASISNSAFGGNSGRSLYGLSGLKGINRFSVSAPTYWHGANVNRSRPHSTVAPLQVSGPLS